MGVSERGKPGFFERWRKGGSEKKDEEIVKQKDYFQRKILNWSHLAIKIRPKMTPKFGPRMTIRRAKAVKRYCFSKKIALFSTNKFNCNTLHAYFARFGPLNNACSGQTAKYRSTDR